MYEIHNSNMHNLTETLNKKNKTSYKIIIENALFLRNKLLLLMLFEIIS